MIQSFGDKATAELRDTGKAKSLPASIWKVAVRKLDMVDAAATLQDLKVPPGNKLHALKEDLAGFHAIRINEQYRVIFRWEADGPHDVQVTDYH